MAILQIKGTRQEVIKMLTMFEEMNTAGMCEVEDYVEIYREASESVLVVALDVQPKQNDADAAERFISQMLTSLYNN